MNRYETFTIFEADVIEDERKEVLDRIEKLVTDQNGTLLKFDHWGNRKLAYPIRKKNQGYYVRTDYCGSGEIVDALERMFSHDQRILRFMTVRTEIDADPEALKSEMTEEKSEETAEVKTGEAAGEAATTEEPTKETPPAEAAAEETAGEEE